MKFDNLSQDEINGIYEYEKEIYKTFEMLKNKISAIDIEILVSKKVSEYLLKKSHEASSELRKCMEELADEYSKEGFDMKEAEIKYKKYQDKYDAWVDASVRKDREVGILMSVKINRYWEHSKKSYKDFNSYIEENDFFIIDEKLNNVTERLEEAEINASYHEHVLFDKHLTLTPECLYVILRKLSSEDYDEQLNSYKEDGNNLYLLINKKNNLKERIKNQDIFRKEKIKDLVVNKMSINGQNMDKFLNPISSNEKREFTRGFIESAKSVLGDDGDLEGVWNEYIVTPAMDLYNAKYELIGLLSEINSIKYKFNRSVNKLYFTYNGMNGIDTLAHYFGRSGKSITLSEIGVEKRIQNLINEVGAFEQNGSIQSRFISQIQRGERINFENSYDFALESDAIVIDPLWTIGGAKIKGIFTDVREENIGDRYKLYGNIDYEFYDKFTDPLDMKNVIGIEIDVIGIPYDITGEWSEKVNFEVDKDVYENKIKPMLEQTKR